MSYKVVKIDRDSWHSHGGCRLDYVKRAYHPGDLRRLLILSTFWSLAGFSDTNALHQAAQS